MGLFKKIKDKLFTLELNEEIKDSQKKEQEPKENKKISNEEQNNKISKLSKAEVKLQKKIEKEKIKKRKKEGKINKYVAGLSKSSSSFTQAIKELQSKHNNIDEEYFEDLEEILIMADISVSLVNDIIDEIKKEVKIENISDPKLITEIIADKMFIIYANKSVIDTTLDVQENRLNVFLMVGVNGVGKTTTIAKLSYKYLQENKKILIAAADTFRAGAVEQLSVWVQRLGIEIVKPIKQGANPSSVVYDALKKAQKEKFDLLIIDTAGRLQNKVNLMNELQKMNSIIEKAVPKAPHESLLVLDATTGQNGVLQAQAFKDVTPLSGVILTKMDGSSKGGIILTIKDKLDLSVRMIGLGEKLDDLEEFDLDAFIYGLTKEFIDEVK